MDKKEAIEKLEAMLNRYDAYHPNSNEFTEYDCEDIRAVIEMVKSIEERPTGHSCNEDFADCDQFVCSECGIELQDWVRIERDDDTNEVFYYEYLFNFCPNCGADMRVKDKLNRVKDELNMEYLARFTDKTPSYETVKQLGFAGSYEDYLKFIGDKEAEKE